jgi:hypothetical protein
MRGIHLSLEVILQNPAPGPTLRLHQQELLRKKGPPAPPVLAEALAALGPADPTTATGPDGEWRVADAVSAITFLKRVMAAPNDNQVRVAQLRLDFGPILKAVALADQAFKCLWANTAHTTPAEPDPTDEQGQFWAGVADAYTGYLPPGYEQDIWDHPNNVVAMILQMSIEKAPNAPQRWLELREFIVGLLWAIWLRASSTRCRPI